MPLRLTLKPHEKIFLGGAVVMNGDARTELTLLNDVAVLRQADILTEATADTACKRLYLLAQLMYMDSPNLVDYHAKFWALAQGIVAERPGFAAQIGAIGKEVTLGNYYRALKLGKKLIAMEKDGTQHAE
jgi:flagellar protein FlbT